MSLNRLLVVGLIGALSLSACNREAQAPATPVDATPVPTTPTAPPINYACESGQTVAVQYTATDTASLAYNGQTYALRLAPAASGARYSGSGLEWWIVNRDGQEGATLSRLGPNEDVGIAVLERCSRPSATRALPSVPADQPQPAPGGVLAAVAPCRSDQLRLASESGDAGAGNRSNVFSVTNSSAAPCSVSGYPAVTLLDGQGRGLTAIRSDQNPNTATPVNVAVGGKAFFDIAWSVVPNEGAGERVCPSATRVRAMIPGQPTALAIPFAFTPCGGRIRVNPFRTAAEPGAGPAPVPASAT